MSKPRSISPPLPLFCVETLEAPLSGVAGERSRTLNPVMIDNSLPPPQRKTQFSGEPLGPVLKNHLLPEDRPQIWRQDRIYEYGRRSRKKNEDDLEFESEFESGNLLSATRIFRQDEDDPELSFPPKIVEHEYNIQMHPDLKTTGHTQWFFFKISGTKSNTTYRFNITNFLKAESLYTQGMLPLLYSTKAACGGDSKKSSTTVEGSTVEGGWRRVGRILSYSRNDILIDRIQQNDMRTATMRTHGGIKFEEDPFQSVSDDEDSADDEAPPPPNNTSIPGGTTHTMSFDLEFDYSDDQVYLAYAHPYTYTDLQQYLEKLTSSPAKCRICSKSLLCKTLAGNRCDLLTITTPLSAETKNYLLNDTAFLTKCEHRRIIVLSARVHPGETNSSWMMHGILEFLTSEHPSALLLRKYFIFKIVPMLNPDGVINGNYRCNLSGKDLNRQWQYPSMQMHPTIASLKEIIAGYQLRGGDESQVTLYCDLHGHSRTQGLFLYGILGNDKVLRRQLSFDKFFDKHLAQSKILLDDEDSHDIDLVVANQPDSCASSASSSKSIIINKVKSTQGRRSNNFSSDPRMFPVMLARRTPGIFAKKQTSFKICRGKSSTARAVVSRELGVKRSYTLESSFCSGISGIYQHNHFTSADFIYMGQQFCLALVDLFDLESLEKSSKTHSLSNKWNLIDEQEIQKSRRKEVVTSGTKHSRVKRRIRSQVSHVLLPNAFLSSGMPIFPNTHRNLSSTITTTRSNSLSSLDLSSSPPNGHDLSLAIKILENASIHKNNLSSSLDTACTELPIFPKREIHHDTFAPPKPVRRKSVGGPQSRRKSTSSLSKQSISRKSNNSIKKINARAVPFPSSSLECWEPPPTSSIIGTNAIIKAVFDFI